jgi:SnoaL-like domain
MVDMASLQNWLDGYVDAWRSNDPAKIEALFTEDAVYAWSPFDPEPARGSRAIVEGWLKEPDEPDSWDCHYEPLAVSGEIGIAKGWTRYHPAGSRPPREFANLFVTRFDTSGRCSEFTEWFMERQP